MAGQKTMACNERGEGHAFGGGGVRSVKVAVLGSRSQISPAGGLE